MGKGISRRGFLGAAGAAAIGATAGWAIVHRIPLRPRKPSNVILIVSDAFRSDRLGAVRGGASLTPNLDAFARDSAVFTSAYSPSSWTKCSMASIISGAYPPYHGVLTGVDTLPKGIDTVASLLKRNGYGTHAIQTNLWLAPEAPTLDTHGVPVKTYGFRQGFDRYLYLQFKGDDSDLGMPAYADAEEVNQSISYLLGRIDRPFFLYVHYMDTHQPWMGVALRAFTGRFATDRRGRTAEQIHLDDRKLIAKAFTAKPEEMTEGDVRRVREVYDESTAYVDDAIGRALKSIASAIDLDDALVIFTADHGDELFEHRGFGHARTLYEEVERVPLIIRGPGVEPARVDHRVSNVTIYETIRTLACPDDSRRTPMGAPLVGRDGCPTAQADELIFAQLNSIVPAENWRLTKVVTPDGIDAILRTEGEKPPKAEVYSLPKDPGETAPMTADAEPFRREAARIERDVKAFASLDRIQYATTEAKWQKNYGTPDADKAVESTMTDEEKRLKEQLKSLGYFN